LLLRIISGTEAPSARSSRIFCTTLPSGLFALLRFIGKKHVGELSPFDLVVLLIISETVDGSLIGDDQSLTGGLISAATLVAIVQIVGYLTWHYR
jgi:uncharacterized membrane protein YcaP (DUF421 family)